MKLKLYAKSHYRQENKRMSKCTAVIQSASYVSQTFSNFTALSDGGVKHSGEFTSQLFHLLEMIMKLNNI